MSQPVTGSAPDIVFDPLSDDFARDPYAVYSQLRAADAPYYYAGHDMWLLSRYEDIAAVATSPDMVRSLAGHESAADAATRQRRMNWHDMPYHERVVQFSLLDSDGPVHRRLRKLVFGAFTTDRLAGLEPAIQAFADALLDRARERETIDFIGDFAAHVPGQVIGRLLGVPDEDAPRLRRWSEQVVQFFDVDRSDARKELAETATREFFHFLTDLKRARMADPQDDLISAMIRDERDGHYSCDEFISTCMLILMAGHGSTIDVLGTGLHTLLTRPDTLAALRADPDALPGAIQEMFRFEPPLPFFHRHALKDTTIRGQTFPAGTTFGLLYASANRDPARFSNPDLFDPYRTPNRHLAFGLGAHLCLGNHLARLATKVVFGTLLRRFPDLALDGDSVSYKRGLSVRGLHALHIRPGT